MAQFNVISLGLVWPVDLFWYAKTLNVMFCESALLVGVVWFGIVIGQLVWFRLI